MTAESGMYYVNGKPVTGGRIIDGESYTFDQNGVTAKKRKHQTYVVKQGDSFWEIACQNHCTI